jgi:outer membrane protein insertion porin family
VKYLRIAIWGVLCAILYTGCSYAPLLKSREYLLHSQSIKGNKSIPKEELVPLYQQLPNRRFAALGTKTYLHLYLIGRESFDSARVGAEIRKVKVRFQQRLDAHPVGTSKVFALKEKLRNDTMSLPPSDTSKLRDAKVAALVAQTNSEIKEILSDTNKRTKIRRRFDKRLKKLETRKREGNYMMRVMGEPPALYDTNLVNATKEQFTSYYASRGYLFTKVTHEADTTVKNVSVTYRIEEHQPLIVKNIFYEIEDSVMKQLYLSDSLHSFFKEGMVYNEEVFNKERERTFKLLKDNGYYFFAKNYIFIDIDTTGFGHEASLYYIIKNPEGQKHKQYVVKDIVINIDKGRPSAKASPYAYVYNDKKYNMYYKRYSRKILNSKIPIKKGVLYSAHNTQRAQNRLSQLQMFKFVNISYAVNNDSLVATITSNSLPKYQINDEFGVNTNVNRQIPGPYGSITFTNRNTFRGCEILDLSLSGGIEGQISSLYEDKFIRTTEINGNAGITFPLLVLPGRLRYSYLDFNPRTRFSLSYVSSYRPDYDRTQIIGTMSYQLQLSPHSRFIVAPLELNLINASIKDSNFANQLDSLLIGGSNIINNFKKSLVTNVSVSYINNNNNPLNNKRSHFFKAYAELGGLTPSLIAGLSNENITQNDSLFDLPYYKYWKCGVDYRYYQPILRKSTLAVRLSSNFVSSFGDNGNGIPYLKYLYAGGVNSIRAWRTRRLGPGSYVVKNADGTFSYRIEQPGEFNIESSIEGRFKIYKFIGIGLFADMGNVWTVKNDDKRLDSQFQLDSFYKQIAVGTGIGLRLDFSFFVFRIDASTKTYDPARPESERFRYPHLTFKDLLGRDDQTVYSFGIGYPF